MTDDKTITGTSDITYNLVSALYHCLEGAKTYHKYLADAEQGEDPELVEFFRGACEEECRRAEAAKQLLAARLRTEA